MTFHACRALSRALADRIGDVPHTPGEATAGRPVADLRPAAVPLCSKNKDRLLALDRRDVHPSSGVADLGCTDRRAVILPHWSRDER